MHFSARKLLRAGAGLSAKGLLSSSKLPLTLTTQPSRTEHSLSKNFAGSQFQSESSPNSAMFCPKLLSLVYDIRPSTTAIVDYAVGLGKMSANEQSFDDAQMAVKL